MLSRVECQCAWCCYAECHYLIKLILSVIMLNFVKSSIVMLSVDILRPVS
jgi:hypothetical protein